MKRRIFQWLTSGPRSCRVWTAYANVFSDDADVRAKARATVNKAAGCGDDCKLEGLRGERGMLEERIEYEVLKHGHYVVICRRAFIVAGDYACEVNEKESSMVSSKAAASSSASPLQRVDAQHSATAVIHSQKRVT